MDLNFNLKPNSKPVDAGVVIPTLNEDFIGKVPDLGAIEVGATDVLWSNAVYLGTFLPF